MVAPSYQKYAQVSEPYEANGKMYIDLRHPSTGNVRKARWYSQNEFEKLYPNEKCAFDSSDASRQEKAMGFPLKVICNMKHGDDEDYCGYTKEMRFAVTTGWYVANTDKIPVNAPAHFRYISLSWDEFKGKTAKELDKLLKMKIKEKQYFTREEIENAQTA